MVNDCPSHWYVGFVRPTAEFLTEKMLWTRSIFAYCPAQTVPLLVSHRRVVVRRTRPLFPRYLFVGFNGTYMFQNVTGTPLLAVLSRIEVEGEEEYKIPVIIPGRAVAELMEKELAGGLDLHHPNDFRENDRVDVTISEGVTMRGLVVHLLRHRRAEVVVEMFGQKRLVKVGFAQLARVG
jgi:hypothetical protein